MSGCLGSNVPVTNGVCDGLRPSVSNFEAALSAHPETPDAVGEAGVDIIVGFDAGCES